LARPGYLAIILPTIGRTSKGTSEQKITNVFEHKKVLEPSSMGKNWMGAQGLNAEKT